MRVSFAMRCMMAMMVQPCRHITCCSKTGGNETLPRARDPTASLARATHAWEPIIPVRQLFCAVQCIVTTVNHCSTARREARCPATAARHTPIVRTTTYCCCMPSLSSVVCVCVCGLRMSSTVRTPLFLRYRTLRILTVFFFTDGERTDFTRA